MISTAIDAATHPVERRPVLPMGDNVPNAALARPTIGDMVRPEITADMRRGAKEHPNTWLYVIDPAFDADADVPPWGVLGAFAVDEHGEIDENFQPNEDYRPGGPVSDLDGFLRELAEGTRGEDGLLELVLDTTLLVYASGPDDHAVTAFPNRDGTLMVPACTSGEHVPVQWPGWRTILGRDLAPRLGGHPLVVNPIGPVTALLPQADLLSALGE